MDWHLVRMQLAGQLRSVYMVGVFAMSCVLVGIEYATTYGASYVVPPSKPTMLRDVMLFSQYGSGSGMYLLLLPFLAALLGGGVMASERHAGRLPAIEVREGRGRFLSTSMVSGFILGGLGGAMPVLLNLVIAGVRCPHLTFIDGDATDAQGNISSDIYVLISSDSWVYPLYKFNQVLFIVCGLLLVFVIAGLYATVAVGASFFVHRKYVELLVPFVLSLVWWMLPTCTGGLVPDEWSHVIFLDFAPPSRPVLIQNVVGVVLSIVLLLGISVALLCVERRRDAS